MNKFTLSIPVPDVARAGRFISAKKSGLTNKLEERRAIHAVIAKTNEQMRPHFVQEGKRLLAEQEAKKADEKFAKQMAKTC